ncbi:putative reverse transcriptase domain-containing protein, partial [Tanacetum coccineum]
FVGPFEITERIGPVAYRLTLPEELNDVHDTFYVSNLKTCLADQTLHVPLEEIKVDAKLNLVEEPVEILERKFKKLKRSRIPIVKVRWNSKRGPKFTCEREDQMKLNRGVTILLDYDETVIPQNLTIKTPSREFISILNILSGDPNNKVVIVTRRGRESLSKAFAPCKKLGIVAEHSYFMRGGEEDDNKDIQELESAFSALEDKVIDEYTYAKNLGYIKAYWIWSSKKEWKCQQSLVVLGAYNAAITLGEEINQSISINKKQMGSVGQEMHSCKALKKNKRGQEMHSGKTLCGCIMGKEQERSKGVVL